jgi:nitrogen regulatory protein PII
MKKIEAIIMPCKLDEVRVELERRGIHATLTTIKVQQAEEQKPSPAPRTESTGPFADRLKIELIVGDRQVQRAVEIITRYGQVALLKINAAFQIIPPLRNT